MSWFLVILSGKFLFLDYRCKVWQYRGYFYLRLKTCVSLSLLTKLFYFFGEIKGFWEKLILFFNTFPHSRYVVPQKILFSQVLWSWNMIYSLVGFHSPDKLLMDVCIYPIYIDFFFGFSMKNKVPYLVQTLHPKSLVATVLRRGYSVLLMSIFSRCYFFILRGLYTICIKLDCSPDFYIY